MSVCPRILQTGFQKCSRTYHGIGEVPWINLILVFSSALQGLKVRYIISQDNDYFIHENIIDVTMVELWTETKNINGYRLLEGTSCTLRVLNIPRFCMHPCLLPSHHNIITFIRKNYLGKRHQLSFYQANVLIINKTVNLVRLIKTFLI